MRTNLYNYTDCYILNTGEIAGGTNNIMFDIFNATGGTPPKDILLLGLYIIPKSDVAVTGLVSARFDLLRTRAAASGGTGQSYGSPGLDALNISPFDRLSPALPSEITARQAPSAPSAYWDLMLSAYVFPEETSAAATSAQGLQLLPDDDSIPPFVLHPGEGLVVQQGTVASVNSYIFRLVFAVAESNRPL